MNIKRNSILQAIKTTPLKDRIKTSIQFDLIDMAYGEKVSIDDMAERIISHIEEWEKDGRPEIKQTKNQ